MHTYMTNIPVKFTKQPVGWLAEIEGSPHPIWGVGDAQDAAMRDAMDTVLAMHSALTEEEDNLGSLMAELLAFLNQFVVDEETFANTVQDDFTRTHIVDGITYS